MLVPLGSSPCVPSSDFGTENHLLEILQESNDRCGHQSDWQQSQGAGFSVSFDDLLKIDHDLSDLFDRIPGIDCSVNPPPFLNAPAKEQQIPEPLPPVEHELTSESPPPSVMEGWRNRIYNLPLFQSYTPPVRYALVASFFICLAFVFSIPFFSLLLRNSMDLSFVFGVFSFLFFCVVSTFSYAFLFYRPPRYSNELRRNDLLLNALSQGYRGRIGSRSSGEPDHCSADIYEKFFDIEKDVLPFIHFISYFVSSTKNLSMTSLENSLIHSLSTVQDNFILALNHAKSVLRKPIEENSFSSLNLVRVFSLASVDAMREFNLLFISHSSNQKSCDSQEKICSCLSQERVRVLIEDVGSYSARLISFYNLMSELMRSEIKNSPPSPEDSQDFLDSLV